jgi:hypothetical protein
MLYSRVIVKKSLLSIKTFQTLLHDMFDQYYARTNLRNVFEQTRKEFNDGVFFIIKCKIMNRIN